MPLGMLSFLRRTAVVYSATASTRSSGPTKGRLWGFDRHWKRFQRSLKEIDLKVVNLEEIRGWVTETYKESRIPNATVYFHLTRGIGPRSHSWSEDLTPSFFMSVRAFVDREMSEGAKVQSFPDQRWGRCDIKSLNLLPNVLAKQQARKLGAYEALLVDTQGNITEGSSSAVIAIVNKTVIAPPQATSILPSVTREYVKEIAAELNLLFQERWLTLAEFGSATEAFLAGTSDEITGITHVDGQTIGKGEVGIWTREILEIYHQRIEQQND